MIKLLPFLLLFHISLYAWSYEDEVSKNSKKYQIKDFKLSSLGLKIDRFLENDFDEIIRFNMISFKGNRVDRASIPSLKKAIRKIKKYARSSRNIRVTIIGHTNAITENENEIKIKSTTYAKYICDIFTSCLTEEDAKLKSTKYATIIQKIMMKNNIKKSITLVDYRSGNDLAFSDSTQEGKDLSNRVMITLYVLSKSSKLRDLSNQYGSKRKRQNYRTADDINDNDNDGVSNSRDECLKTPRGVKTDRVGCPLDKDKDGVPDYKDRCLHTAYNVRVDINGCEQKNTKIFTKTLNIHFESGSDRIEYVSFPEINKFGKFLKKNPAFYVDIIGHTDNRGKASVNLALSKSRAIATKEALIIEGIDSRRLTAYGRGELEPIKTNRTKKGREANRRIDVRLFY